jgi:hypothetical protein
VMHKKVEVEIAVFINSLLQTENVSHNKYVTKRKEKKRKEKNLAMFPAMCYRRNLDRPAAYGSLSQYALQFKDLHMVS